ncbi:MAG TPA: hypothetical protein VFE46_17370 [Pirellulales bacterium]|jgi:hypothetical protein|nr:hypothetical protein [Pirellulales bacterium]
MRRFIALWIPILALGFAATANAQLLKGRVRPQEPEVEAFAGEPYGVGRWTVALPPGVNPALLGNNGFTLTEKTGRTLYQAFQAEPLRTAAREILGRPQTATVYFLFTGDAPLDLQLYAPVAASISVTPQHDPVGHERLISDWWVKYTRQANRIDRPADYPPLVDNYLLTTLARRLNLPPASQISPPPIRLLADGLLNSATGGQPKLPTAQTGDEQANHQLGLLLGSESLRNEMQTQVLLRRSDTPEVANQPLPAGVQFTSSVPETLGEVAIEPLAGHVPADCFYIRYGNFTNYLWFRHTLDRWSGDLQNLINRRGIDYGLTPRIERQLSLKESVLAPILGPAVIADVAMIGNDFFFREGATIGFLFQARNNLALNSDFTQQRAATLKREPGCTEEQVEIAGHTVLFLSTPDNRVRSFYAIDGDFHFVTNSRHLVEQFYEAAAGKHALGSSPEFRYARSLMPGNRDYSVFVYLSSEFFGNLAGPRYQVEMDRRLRSAAEIDMALVAQLAAQGDGVKVGSLDDLIKSQYLPAGFGQRSDGSRLEMTADGDFTDTLRGGRGTFAPAADVAFQTITAAEASRYQDFAAWLQSKWSTIDPVVAGIRREPSKTKEPGVERILIDAQVTPLAAANYQTIATALGPISKQKLAPVPGDIATGEASLSGNLLASKGLAAPQGAYRLFGALRDAAPQGLNSNPGAAGEPTASQTAAPAQPLLQIQPGQGGVLNGPLGGVLANALGNGQGISGLSSLSPLSLLPPFYFGATPTPALFASIGVGEVPLDAADFGRAPSGLWQRRMGQFTIASMQREILETITPQLKFVDAPRPAQAWFHVGDLGRSKVASTVNGMFYLSAKNAAIGNVRFLQSLTAQLRVPPEDCVKVAERLTDANLVCPVGGKYQLEERTGTLPTWISTALPSNQMRLISGLFTPAPASYVAPVLNWLRGLDADVALDQRILSLHAEVEMQNGPVGGLAFPAANGSNAAAGANGNAQRLPTPPKPRGEEIPPPPLPQPNP